MASKPSVIVNRGQRPPDEQKKDPKKPVDPKGSVEAARGQRPPVEE